MPPLRFQPKGLFADPEPRFGHLLRKARVLRRIDHVEPAGVPGGFYLT